jgi:type II secretory pathway component PulF
LTMPLFEYKARDRMGALVAGKMDAPTAEAVGNELDRLGHFPVTIKSMETEKLKEEKIDLLDRFQKIKMKELVLFTRQMSTLFNAGIPVLGILVALEDQVETPKFKRVVRQVRLDIEGGLSLSESMEKHPDVFDVLYTSMIAAGEAGGVMEELLKRLASMMERQVETDAKVKGAMSYPKMVISAMTIAVVILMVKVVPIFVNMFEKAKIELPLATQILIGANKAFFDYWYFLLGGIILTVIAFKKYTATETGHYNWDMFMLKVPIMGPIVLRSSMAKFARVFSTLQAGGVSILNILSVTAKVVDNVVISSIVLGLRDSVQEGLGLAAPLKQSGLIPPLVIQMIAAGEESGALDEMLSKVADYYDDEVDHAVKNLSSMIEPILLLFMACLVLFLALAIFMPMWDMTKMAH